MELIKNINNRTNIEAINELYSDHIPIKLTLKNSETHLNETTSFLTYNKADWKKFSTLVSEKIDLNEKIKPLNKQIENMINK